MTKGQYFYEIQFLDDRGTVRRENVTKSMAESVYNSMCEEMHLFRVFRVCWGKMH